MIYTDKWLEHVYIQVSVSINSNNESCIAIIVKFSNGYKIIIPIVGDK